MWCNSSVTTNDHRSFGRPARPHWGHLLITIQPLKTPFTLMVNHDASLVILSNAKAISRNLFAIMKALEETGHVLWILPDVSPTSKGLGGFLSTVAISTRGALSRIYNSDKNFGWIGIVMAVFLWWRIKHVTWVNTCLLWPIPVHKVSGLCAKKSINIWHSIGFSVTWLKPKGGEIPSWHYLWNN